MKISPYLQRPLRSVDEALEEVKRTQPAAAASAAMSTPASPLGESTATTALEGGERETETGDKSPQSRV
jgi:hypothetical protein